MRLDLLSRARIRASRPLVRWAFRAPSLHGRLVARRRADVARGLDPDVAALLALGDLTGDTGLGRTTPQRERRSMAVSIAIVDDAPRGEVKVSDRTVPGAAGMLGARLYEPAGLTAPSPGLVYLHGGGWVTGDLDTHDTFCRRLALVGDIRVIAIAPRLAPEHPFPAPVDDSVAAFRYVASRAHDFGIDPARLGVGGDSAGGNLSAVVGLATRADAREPALTVLIYPSVDATCSQPSHVTNGQGYLLTNDAIAWYLEHYLQGDPALKTNPRVSPLHERDVAGAPRALIAVAGFDPLCDEGELYARKLEAAGTPTEVLRFASLPHGFVLTTAVSKACLAAAEAIARRTGELLRET